MLQKKGNRLKSTDFKIIIPNISFETKNTKLWVSGQIPKSKMGLLYSL